MISSQHVGARSERCYGDYGGPKECGSLSKSWFDRVLLSNDLHVQTLVLTDVQTPFLGTRLVPLKGKVEIHCKYRHTHRNPDNLHWIVEDTPNRKGSETVVWSSQRKVYTMIYNVIYCWMYYTCVYIYIYIVYAYMYTHTYICTYMHTQHIYLHIYIYICIYTVYRIRYRV